MLDIRRGLERLDDAACRACLAELLEGFCRPAFGARGRRETELLVLSVLRRAGLVAAEPQLYRLMRDLGLSRARARALLFDLEIRDSGTAALDARLRRAILSDSYFRDETWFVIEIDSPLLEAHLREGCRRAGVVTDASFRSGLVRLPVPGLAALLEEVLEPADRAAVRRGLIRAGRLPDTSLRGLLRDALAHLAARFAGRAMGAAVDGAVGAAGERLAEFLAPLLAASEEDIADVWSGVFRDAPARRGRDGR